MKKIIEKLKSLSKGTIVRTILQVLVYINQVVAIIGRTTFAEAVWYQWVTFGLTVAITAFSYWYNNDWSSTAQICSDIFNMLSDGKITKEEIEEFIKKHSKGSDNND